MKSWSFLFILAIFLINMGCGSKEEKESAGQAMQKSHSSLPAGPVRYEAPDGWVKEETASAMRKDQYRLPGVDGKEDATLAVFFFPGTGGSVQANLDRWYGQFKQPDGSDTKSHVEKKRMNVDGLPVTIVYVTGTFLQSQSPMMMGGPVEEKPGYAMLAAIAETQNGPWFYKATGPVETIDHWRQSFEDFVRSFQAHSSQN